MREAEGGGCECPTVGTQSGQAGVTTSFLPGTPGRKTSPTSFFTVTTGAGGGAFQSMAQLIPLQLTQYDSTVPSQLSRNPPHPLLSPPSSQAGRESPIIQFAPLSHTVQGSQSRLRCHLSPQHCPAFHPALKLSPPEVLTFLPQHHKQPTQPVLISCPVQEILAPEIGTVLTWSLCPTSSPRKDAHG